MPVFVRETIADGERNDLVYGNISSNVLNDWYGLVTDRNISGKILHKIIYAF